MSKRIPAARVQHVQKPALVACDTTDDAGNTQSMTVVPLVNGDAVAGFEVRCRCGSRAVVDCVYDPEPAVEPAGEPAPPSLEETNA